MTVNIHKFLQERKESWLKERIKKADDAEIVILEQQATDKFNLVQWIPDAAKRAGKISIVSHPCKFSHPSAKTSNVITNAQGSNDGYLRSGNVNYQLDFVCDTAAVMDVYKFLQVKLSNGKTILENLEYEDELIKHFFQTVYLNYEDLRNAFLSIKEIDVKSKTDRLVKQVYFPTEQIGYHLLSILTPSGLLTEVKKRIDILRFSDDTKQAKESKRKNDYHPIGFADVYNLTVTLYGGTQPQNISVLNSQNAGRAYLLPSIPPLLEKIKIRLPNTDFFVECLYYKKFKDSFINLHKLMKLEINNINIRNAIQNIICFIIDEILAIAFKIRQYDSGWSNNDYYSNLTKNQRIWLDDIHQKQRIEQKEWREEISQEVARWILKSYEKLIQNANMLGDEELKDLQKIAIEAIEQDKEFF